MCLRKVCYVFEEGMCLRKGCVCVCVTTFYYSYLLVGTDCLSTLSTRHESSVVSTFLFICI